LWAISSVTYCGLKTDCDSHLNLGFGFGSVFTENRGFGFGFKTDPALVNLTAVSLHCSNYTDKTSHCFCQLCDPSQHYGTYVSLARYARGEEVMSEWLICFDLKPKISKFSYSRDISNTDWHICRVSYILVFNPRTVIAPPLSGLNLMECEIYVFAGYATSSQTSQPNNWRVWYYSDSKLMCRIAHVKTVDINIDRYAVKPPCVRPHFSYLSIF